MNYLVGRIISGGQSGADQGGLAAGIIIGIPTGGWAPHGWRTERGSRPALASFGLKEYSTPGYPARTEANVIEGDATVVFYRGELERGSQLTVKLAAKYGKPCCPVPLDLFDDREAAYKVVRPWLLNLSDQGRTRLTLNVAGNRESVAPGIFVRVRSILPPAIMGWEV